MLTALQTVVTNGLLKDLTQHNHKNTQNAVTTNETKNIKNVTAKTQEYLP